MSAPPARSAAGPRPAWRVRLVAAAAAGAVVLGGLHVPLVEDGLFWWVPKGLYIAEHGLTWSAAGDLPDAVAAPLAGHDPIPQWAAGLPDWDHPPLWFWWLGLFLSGSPDVAAVHLAGLPVAILAAVGWVAVAEQLRRPWAGVAVLALPPVIAQLLRPDLDLPLLAVVPWALAAACSGAWGRFAVLGFIAPWVKEPGVLLVVPAILAAAGAGLRPARVLASLAPLTGLGAWRFVHGPLARPEHLPADALAYLHDLALVARFALWEQGRWLLLPGTLLLARHLRRAPSARGPAVVLAGLVVTWLLFFAAVGFFAGVARADTLTHVRYFLPGLCGLTVLCAAGLPALAAPGLFWLTVRAPWGPEASLWGLQAALAERDAAPRITAWLEAGRTVWVGTYQAAGLLQPWAGITDAPPPPTTPAGGRLRIYAYGT
ncbi:MAG: hypothetical protein D6798_08970, partial [Deltaproteobacteria bacterium]